MEEQLLKNIRQCIISVEEGGPKRVSELYSIIQKFFENVETEGEIYYRDGSSYHIRDAAHCDTMFMQFTDYSYSIDVDWKGWKIFFVYDDAKLFLSGIALDNEGDESLLPIPSIPSIGNDFHIALFYEEHIYTTSLGKLFNDEGGWFRCTNNSIPLNESDIEVYKKFQAIVNRLGL